MLKDHSAANAKRQGTAAAQNVKVPTSASVMQMASQKKVRIMSGASSDRSCIKDQIKAHEDTVELFKQGIAAASTLPTGQAHLAKIKQIAASAGVSTK